MNRMNKKLFIGVVSCIMAMGLQAETVRVLRFVPVAGEEREVAVDSLRKEVFTRDSIVLIAATTGEATPMYKYDYRSILFAESSPTGIVTVNDERLTVNGEKFIKDGRLFILYDGRMYDIRGRRVE